MPDSFATLASSITRSTVWDEPHYVRIVWITMLALKDHKGSVYGSVPGLAHEARVTLQECEDALKRFQSPDPHSRTQDHEGRRIEPIDGGWRILNHDKYRLKRDPEKRKEQNRKAQQLQRDKNKKTSATSAKVSHGQPISAHHDHDHDHRTTQQPCRAEARRVCEVCEKTLAHLNDRTGKNYRLVGQTRDKIHACHRRVSKNPEKALDATLSVVDWLYDAWSGTEMSVYLRPSTIFAPSKFMIRWEELQAGAPPPGKAYGTNLRQ